MKIDAKKLRELHVKHVKTIAPDERFYEVKDTMGYALSTYGRLYRKNADGNWHKVSVKFIKSECYEIVAYTGNRVITVHQLMAEVFFRDHEWVYLYNPNFSPLDPRRWRIEDLYSLTEKDDLIEVLQSKMDGRAPNLPDEKMRNTFINRYEPKKSMNDYINQQYNNMRSRATNPKVKKINPRYTNVTMSSEWLEEPEKFKQYLLDHQYYHPDSLSIDKDLLCFGNKPRYEDGTVAFVPLYINNIFTEHGSKLGYSIQLKEYGDGTRKYKLPGIAFTAKGKRNTDQYFDRYLDALVAGRKRKATYIRDIVANEQERGFMPEYILEAMLKWADRCEFGLIKIWEPDPDVLQELGVI